MGFRHYFWTPGEPWRTVRSWLVPRTLRVLHSTLMNTLRISVTGGAQLPQFLDNPQREQGALLVTWHDLTFMPLHLLRNKNIGVMMSASRAGQMQAAFWRLYGWPTVWGSTKKREGIKAVREVIRLLRTGQSFAFTPDGPKGPRHHAQPGVIYFASNAPAVIIPFGVAASSAWNLPTWDRYLIPKPFSRVHIHLGEALTVPPQLSREEMEEWRLRVQSELDQVNEVARQHLENQKVTSLQTA
jgi:lysophospholipid acyltransferase (LPLAT)-like uncharacterized protein